MTNNKFNVVVNGKSHKVEITETSVHRKIIEQRRVAQSIIEYIKSNPSAFFALCGFYISYCGLCLLWYRFKLESVELFDYISFQDLFFGFFSVSYGLVSVIVVLALVYFGFLGYRKEVWKTGVYGFWVMATLYIFGLPFIVGFVHLELFGVDKLKVCDPKATKYEVTYKFPNEEVVGELYLVSSLSDFKIFKRSKRGCNAPPKDGESLLDFHVLAISTSSIQSMEHKL